VYDEENEVHKISLALEDGCRHDAWPLVNSTLAMWMGCCASRGCGVFTARVGKQGARARGFVPHAASLLIPLLQPSQNMFVDNCFKYCEVHRDISWLHVNNAPGHTIEGSKQSRWFQAPRLQRIR
jgi:hypothetical protein